MTNHSSRVRRPVRACHTYTQHLNAPPEDVFPLLCPVRELEWVPDWDPSLVISESGVVEPDCIFVTPDGDGRAIWVVTLYDPTEHRIQFLKVTPGRTVGRISIILLRREGERTAAEVTYQYTAISEAGEAAVREFTEGAYRAFMRGWEKALNHYLETGTPVQR